MEELGLQLWEVLRELRGSGDLRILEGRAEEATEEGKIDRSKSPRLHCLSCYNWLLFGIPGRTSSQNCG